MKRFFLISLFALTTLFANAQVVLGQVDTFTDGTTMFWSGGANPVNIPSGGPAGATDAYLQFAGLGGFGAGSVPAVNNNLQWSGNFTSAAVTIVRMNMRNFSAVPLNMRLMFNGPTGARWVTHPGFSLPGNSGWVTATYFLRASNMVLVAGTDTLAATLAANSFMQVRNDFDPPSSGGEGAAATVGIDNVSALSNLSADASSYSVDTGLDFGGTLASLHLSDNDSVFILNDEFDANATLTMTTTRPTTLPVPFNSPSKIRIRREAAASRNDLIEFLRAYNYSTSAFNNITNRITTFADAILNTDITSNVTNYINSTTGESKAQIFWVPTADVSDIDGWVERVDEIEWQFYP